MWDYMGQHMGGYGWGGLGMLMMILFWALVIGLIVLLVRSFGGASGGRSGPREQADALDILRERYARGEIDREEYEERKSVLERR